MTGTVSHAESDTAGTYTFENLCVEQYSLWVRAAGQDTLWISKVVVERGQTTHRDLHLIRTQTATTGM